MMGPVRPRDRASSPGPDVWGGVECTFREVAGRVVDQLERTGHAARAADLGTLPDLGLRAMRYPVLWGWRGHPQTDWAWADERIGGLLRRSIEPVAGLLHHGWGPDGDHPLRPGYAERFAAYAATVARRYPAVRTYLPINEPMTTARFEWLYGWWASGRDDQERFVRTMIGACEAIAAAARAIKAVRPAAVVIANEDLQRTSGTPELAGVVAFDSARAWLTWDLLLGRVVPGHPMWGYLTHGTGNAPRLERLARDPAPIDVLGVDRYVTSDRFLDHRVDLYPDRTADPNGPLPYVDIESVRVADADWDPFHVAIVEAWSRYRLPIVLTEVQLDGEDAQAAAWWDEAVLAVDRACADGADVRAITTWSMFGSWDWDTLLRADGVTWSPPLVPGPGGPGRPRTARAVRMTARGKRPSEAPRGWWRDRSRVLVAT